MLCVRGGVAFAPLAGPLLPVGGRDVGSAIEPALAGGVLQVLTLGKLGRVVAIRAQDAVAAHRRARAADRESGRWRRIVRGPADPVKLLALAVGALAQLACRGVRGGRRGGGSRRGRAQPLCRPARGG